MNPLKKLIKTKLKLQDHTVFGDAFPEWDAPEAGFSSEVQRTLQKIKPDAVYHFNHSPFILFFDFCNNKNRLREKSIHKQIWCFDKSPAAFFVFEDQIKIYNAFDYQRDRDELAEIDSSDYEKHFSFWNLQSGNTWLWIKENFYKKNIDKLRVEQKLFENIKDAREKLTDKNGLTDTFANILILRLIFIRYLIDREVEIDEELLPGIDRETKRNSFNKLIADKKRLNSLFKYLKERFNGNLFEIKEEPEIDQEHLNNLSQIFAAHKKQLFLFDVFDFSIIPVEQISGIYESVIDPEDKKHNSAIYTPSFLVDYILSQTVNCDFLEKNKECRILDPACGSGIFLVQAYRILVERNKDKKSGISDSRLVELAQQNLFGIDDDPDAVNIAAFSIYIALLDYKEPREIKEFKLPNLIGKNLFKADFFDQKAEFNFKGVFKDKEFDFIMGNPPWGSKKTAHHLDYIKKNAVETVNFEISQTFCARVKDFVSEKTKCALIVSGRALYNSQDRKS